LSLCNTKRSRGESPDAYLETSSKLQEKLKKEVNYLETGEDIGEKILNEVDKLLEG
jgi:hypothetical protein